uniref:flagellum-associated coiled-coil domain-containing protein 1 n=1 Tax=Euleptes europaea TaxID=460621 RepID=UPI00253FDDA6|nr:flagellum-associated coiled-coil domain-containing protein 1 [Euleptes europaea]
MARSCRHCAPLHHAVPQVETKGSQRQVEVAATGGRSRRRSAVSWVRYLATQIPRSADRSRANFTNCPCWDPWKRGCRRLTRPKTGTLSRMPTIKFIPGTQKLPLRGREAQDISKEFIRLSPSFLLSHSKDQISVTLEEGFFEKTRPFDASFPKPSVPSSPPKLETEDVVADLVEQISELTGIMEQLRRDHEKSHKQLENEMEEKCRDLQEEHEIKVGQLEAAHKLEMNALEDQHKKELRAERATAQEKLSGMQKEYKYLKNAFRVYQDSISDEMEEKWLRRQAEWKKSERTEREKALLQQKQALTRKFEMELEEQKKMIQNSSFLIDRVFQQEKEVMFQREKNPKRQGINELNKYLCALEEELKEKNETLNAIASSLHNTEMELQHVKAALAEAEKSIQQRIVVIEDKHRIAMNTLVEESVALRRKLLEKNEEILSIRAQRSVLF